jgi:hypothetical protein
MSTNPLYHTWIKQMLQQRPGERINRIRNLVQLMIGMYKSKSVHLSKIAGEVPGKARQPSITRRLSRFIQNQAVQVWDWYGPIARQWIDCQVKTCGEVRLVVDGTKAGLGYEMLMISLAFRRRTVPLVWQWVRKPRGKGRSSVSTQLALLRLVHGLIPAGIKVLVVGDSEFGDIPVLQQLESWEWQYALRQRGKIQVKLAYTTVWRDFRHLVQQPGQTCWATEVLISLKYLHMTNLFACWQVGEKQPWLLLTNLPDPRSTRQAYQRRMWIEEMFGDFKANGVDLAGTRLRSPDRLSRLTLAVALLFCWCITTGFQVIKKGQRNLIDRSDRRDLSIFQIGWRFLIRQVTNESPVAVCLSPYPTQTVR